MRYAIMSDAHSNPAALETAIADARGQGCEKFLFLGDVTGYGYDAKRTLDMVRENFSVVLLGNHDSACLGREVALRDVLNPNYDIDRMQHDLLGERDLKWLGSRRLFRKVDGMALVHGDFVRPEAWNYVFGSGEALFNFAARRERLMFCGHTHHLAVWEKSGKGKVECVTAGLERRLVFEPESIVFEARKGVRRIVNVGSVGYPRNDLCATYAICDPAAGFLAVRRIPFDFKSYISEMMSRGLGLPAWLCDLVMAARDP